MVFPSFPKEWRVITLGAEAAEEALDAQSQSARERDQLVPMLDHGKRTRIYAVLAYAFRAEVKADTALKTLEQACLRKNQEDKQLGAAVAQILATIKLGENVGEALGRVLGRMLSVEEASILQLLASDERVGSATNPELHAMEMLLRLREIDLLEARRPQ